MAVQTNENPDLLTALIDHYIGARFNSEDMERLRRAYNDYLGHLRQLDELMVSADDPTATHFVHDRRLDR